jgi:hypothetical protein
MANQDLIKYINKCRAGGMSDEAISTQLYKAGWPEAEIKDGLAAPMPPPLPDQPRVVNFQPAASGSPRMGRFKASRMIVSSSWNIMKKDKEMLWFPVLSSICGLLIIISVFLAYFFVFGGDLKSFSSSRDEAEKQFNSAFPIMALIMYFLIFFVTTFFQSAIVSIVKGRIGGQDLTFKDGLNNAFKHIGKIVLWSLLAASVGVILQTIAERSKIIGKIVVWVLGSLWSILSFFIIPILIIEDLSLKDSLKKSAAIIKKTWGEAIVINVGLGLYFVVLALLGSVLFLATIFTGYPPIILIGFLLIVLYIVGLAVVFSALDTVYKVVLYQYADTGSVPEGFSPEVLQYAFKPKK